MEKKIEINKSKTPPKASSADNLTGKKKTLDKIEINPKVASPMSEQAGNAVVLTFGRFNPPTTGHQKLVEAVKKIAASKKAKPLVYLSHTQDSKKNPLSYKDKTKFAREAFGDIVHTSKAKTIIEALKELQSTYKNVTVVVGSDRVNEFNTLLNKYNGKEYQFDSIVVESAGERDPDAEGVAGMSASKMRQAVAENNMKAFKSGLPTKLKAYAEELFDLLKAEMHIKEEMDAELAQADLLNEAVLNLQQRIKRKIIMRKYKTKLQRMRELSRRKMASSEKLKVRAQKLARDVARKKFAGQRGVKYHELSPSDKIAVDKLIDKKGALIKRIASRLLPTVRKKEIQRLQSFTSGAAMKSEHTPTKSIKEDTSVKASSDYKIIIDKDGNKRKVRAHHISFAKEEDMITFKEMVQQTKRRGRPASPETLAKRAAAAKAKAKEDGEEDYGPDNGREPDQNLIVQLQKSITMHGKMDVAFDQGPAVNIKPEQARKALDHYFGLKKPADKLAFIKHASANFTNFKKMIGEEAASGGDEVDDLLTIIESVMDRIEKSELSEEVSNSLKKKSEKTGISFNVLKQVYKRGTASSMNESITPQQSAFARVNSFISGGKARLEDADLWEKVMTEGKNGLWANIHAKRERIKNGSGERMRKPGSKGAPTDQALKDAQEAFKMPKETAAEKAYRVHQELRKKSGLPDPEEYKKRIAQKQKEIDALRNEEVEIDENEAFIHGIKTYVVSVSHKTESGKTGSRDHAIHGATNRHHAVSIAMNRHRKDVEKSGEKVTHQSGSVTKTIKKTNEEIQIDEISSATKASYTEKAKQQIAQTKPFTKKGEYKDIAKNFIKKREKGIAKANEEVEINEDAASHLRAAGAAQSRGQHIAAAIHRKIAAALQRGDNATAAGFKNQLQKMRAKKANESLNEQIEWNVIDYSNMKPIAAPTVAEMKDFMQVQAGFEHHPEVKKLMSFKEARAMTSTTVRSSKQMENDPEDQVFVGSYRSKHFEVSPEAQKLYMNLPKTTDPNMASMAAQQQDNLFGIWKKVQVSMFATPEDVAAAKDSAMKVMKFAGDMNLNSEHGYIVDIYRKIVDAQSGNTDRPPSEHLPDDPRFQTLPKNLNQEPGPGNDKDVDNLSNYLISRNIKAQRKLKIIDAD